MQVPHDQLTEKCLLGALILDQKQIPALMHQIKPAMFYLPRHQQIYQAILSTHEKGTIDPITVYEEWKKIGIADMTYLVTCCEQVPTALMAGRYVEILKDKWDRRELIRICEEGRASALTRGHEVNEAISTVENQLHSLNRSVTTPQDPEIGGELMALYERYLDTEDQEPRYIPTGFLDLDRQIGGLEPGTHTIIAGRPSMGKSALALSIASNVAAKGRRPLVFSLEQTRERALARIMAINVPVSLINFKTKQLTREEKGLILSRLPYIATNLKIGLIAGNFTPAEIKAHIVQEKYKRPVDVVFIDFLTQIKPPPELARRHGETGHEVIGPIAKRLEEMAMELDLPVVTMAQLSRKTETRPNKRPIMSDLRESGSIEEYADIVMFIYREGYYDPANKGNIAELIIAKNRDGPTGTVEILWQPEITRYVSLSRSDMTKYA